MSRIQATFDRLAAEGRAAFVPFIMAGDPDLETSIALLNALPQAGADVIELGVAFTDPMADGPTIEAAGLRALDAGQTLRKTLGMVERFRAEGHETPVVLMGYFNPIHAMGAEPFAAAAAAAGVDGLNVVDLPPEEDAVLREPAAAQGLDLIRLATPTTDANRLPVVLTGASGFLYYVAVAGVTGRAGAQAEALQTRIAALKAHAALPIAVGFGVKTPEQAAAIARFADGVVVGSALVERLAAAVAAHGLENPAARHDIVEEAVAFAASVAAAVRQARR